MTIPGFESGPPRWETSDWPLELWRGHNYVNNRDWFKKVFKNFPTLYKSAWSRISLIYIERERVIPVTLRVKKVSTATIPLSLILIEAGDKLFRLRCSGVSLPLQNIPFTFLSNYRNNERMLRNLHNISHYFTKIMTENITNSFKNIIKILLSYLQKPFARRGHLVPQEGALGKSALDKIYNLRVTRPVTVAKWSRAWTVLAR
jgi:hypothetical protein